MKLQEPARILRKQELKQEWSERRLELKREAKDILLKKYLSKNGTIIGGIPFVKS
ncbi:hypothetical protein ACLMAB_14230 [Brevibacillus laterosporus]